MTGAHVGGVWSRGQRHTGWLALLAVVAALAMVVALPAGAAHAAAAGERILSFTATYAVQPDGSVDVTERIRWQFGPGEHHGIKRNIITRQGYGQSGDKTRLYPLSDARASSPTGAPTAMDTSEFGASTVLRIGDPNQTVHGTQTYVVHYTLAHVVNLIVPKQQASSGPNATRHVELYWNVLGTQTTIPTDKASITVTGPGKVTDAACYVGATRSDQRCPAKPGRAAHFSAVGLGPHQGMTVVAAFPEKGFTDTSKDIVAQSPEDAGGGGTSLSGDAARAVTLLSSGVGIAVPLLTAGFMGLMVWRNGRDERFAGLTPGVIPAPGEQVGTTRDGAGPVAVRFSPPDGVRPGLVGTIIDEDAGTIDVSATVVDLAVRGLLRIEEIPSGGLGKLVGRKDWRLTRLDPPEGQQLLPYEQTVLSGLFASGNDVMLSELKNHFHTSLESAKRQMYAETVRRGWFRQSPERTRSAWKTFGTVVFFVGVASGWFYGFGSSDIDARGGLSLGIPSGVILALGLALAGALIWVLGKRMPARTAVGSAVLAQSDGFREYLTTAEADQIRFEEAQDVFSRYLPYAIVFGVADRWARVFGQVAEAAEAAGQPLVMPTWYLFAGSPNFGGFAGIADGVDNFSTMASGTFTSTPGSSGGSGFSGGGFGGGFSGGGGGGGGSSSW
ncbi:MAG TPA: DUF2207 domain-containing protein [Segeticoccus sp.]|uniref:DUF2207 domain-containing protein n=1 Tax=Segeticoccus sp. TaxID=2706531 RepID=UPI002D7F3662|nr:DUF2207 domain-containing protein [Segeticoccus sp.]HET8599939.1 DUF2207 domain-containing protein [Segeticoccus sp.]